MQDIYADTVSAINFNNGMVRMYLVDLDPVEMSKEGADPSKIEPRLKDQIIMPLPGFLYMVSIIKNLVDDPKVQKMVEKYVELGLLPPVDTQAPQSDGNQSGATQPIAVNAAE